MSKLEFWYDLASNYAYLSAMRIEDLAADADVEVEWRPFLLGPIFASQGWDTSPFNVYPAKGRYMQRDMARLCEARALPPFALPDPFPQNSLRAARIALVGCRQGWVAAYSKAVFCRQFQARPQGANPACDISNLDVLAGLLRSIDLAPEPIIELSQSDDIKQALRRQSAAAQEAGIFGAPSFVTETGELFWGDDRLENALQFAQAN